MSTPSANVTPPAPIGTDAPILQVMKTMRAMRRLKPDAVPDHLLYRLVEAATWAPSGGNVQAYQYVVVTDRHQIARIAELWKIVVDYYLDTIGTVVPSGAPSPEAYERMRAALRYQRDHFHQTPALIVPCYNTGPFIAQLARQTREFIIATASLGPRRAALLARHGLRWNAMSEAASVYPGVQNLLLTARALGLGATLTTWHLPLEAQFKATLGIPRRVKTFAIIPIGWPCGNLGPVTRRPADQVIHHDHW